ncbi:hypothetical protein [Muricoccus pecuniae]|uniref:Uncharacterized protein n=1 Tax=Muricoccus pecuniae TaxID=693023 RepID=A0A840YA68_9PROT|nr:hypothetical protein [Roseomonas pecuniae]MBB5695599.1 hypothetical protein [Roseomonas pecuniae]
MRPGAARLLLLPLLLLGAGEGGAPAACAAPLARPIVQARPEPPPRSCGGGRETLAFGRLLVDYGVETLRYGIGIVLIFLGLVVMALGYLLLLIEIFLCW